MGAHIPSDMVDTAHGRGFLPRHRLRADIRRRVLGVRHGSHLRLNRTTVVSLIEINPDIRGYRQRLTDHRKPMPSPRRGPDLSVHFFSPLMIAPSARAQAGDMLECF